MNSTNIIQHNLMVKAQVSIILFTLLQQCNRDMQKAETPKNYPLVPACQSVINWNRMLSCPHNGIGLMQTKKKVLICLNSPNCGFRRICQSSVVDHGMFLTNLQSDY